MCKLSRKNITFTGKLKNLTFTLLIIFIFSSQTFGQDYQQAQSRLKAIFVYNFLKYVEWPEFNSANEVTICLLGEDAIFAELNKLAASKTVQNRKIIINKISSTSNCSTCDLLFLDSSAGVKVDGDERPDGCTKFIVTDNDFNESVSNINLRYKDNRLGFEINSVLCEQNGFRLSSQLKSLAF
jgi:hypothetical protein